jgi:hypothetical protein
MRIDWQRYDGWDLGPEQVRGAEQALRSDPRARRELEARLAAVVGDQPPVARHSRRPLLLAAAAAVLAVLAFALWPTLTADPDQEQRRAADDLGSAVSWAAQRSDLSVKGMDHVGAGKLVSVHAARGWACFDYEVGGATVHVRVSEGLVAKAGCHLVETEDGAVYVHDATSTIRFSKSGLLYVVAGPDVQTGMSVVKAILD